MIWGFVAMAVVVGVVVFGGTTLAYFQEQRRPDRPRSAPAGRPGATASDAAHRHPERRTT